MTATGPSGPPPGRSSCVGERPAEDRGHAEDVEHRPAGPQAVDELALAAHGQIEARARHRERAIEQVARDPGTAPRSGWSNAVRRPDSLPRRTSCGARRPEAIGEGACRGPKRSRCWRRCRAPARGSPRPTRAGVPFSVRQPYRDVLHQTLGRAPAPDFPRRLADQADIAEVPRRADRASSAERPAATRSSASSARWNRISSSRSDSLRFQCRSARRRA